jgi:hypothetical protein
MAGKLSARRTADCALREVAKAKVKGEGSGSKMLIDEDFCALEGVSPATFYALKEDPAYKKQVEKYRKLLEAGDMNVSLGVMRQIGGEESFRLLRDGKASPSARLKAWQELDALTKRYGEVGLLMDVGDLGDEELVAGLSGLDPDTPEGRAAVMLAPAFVSAVAYRPKESVVASADTSAPDLGELEAFLAVPEHRRLFDDWRRTCSGAREDEAS